MNHQPKRLNGVSSTATVLANTAQAKADANEDDILNLASVYSTISQLITLKSYVDSMGTSYHRTYSAAENGHTTLGFAHADRKMLLFEQRNQHEAGLEFFQKKIHGEFSSNSNFSLPADYGTYTMHVFLHDGHRYGLHHGVGIVTIGNNEPHPNYTDVDRQRINDGSESPHSPVAINWRVRYVANGTEALPTVYWETRTGGVNQRLWLSCPDILKNSSGNFTSIFSEIVLKVKFTRICNETYD